jgi:hypothetical protein
MHDHALPHSAGEISPLRFYSSFGSWVIYARRDTFAEELRGRKRGDRTKRLLCLRPECELAFTVGHTRVSSPCSLLQGVALTEVSFVCNGSPFPLPALLIWDIRLRRVYIRPVFFAPGTLAPSYTPYRSLHSIAAPISPVLVVKGDERSKPDASISSR